MGRKFVPVIAVALLGLVTSCGDDDSDDASEATPAPTSAEATADTTAETTADTTATTEAATSETTAAPTATTAADETDGEWDEIVAAAEAEGTVTLYTAFPGTELTLPEAFAQDYPNITLEAIRIPTADLIPRLEAEAASQDGGDIVLMSGTSWFQAAADAGDMTTVESPRLSDWPADFIGADDQFVVTTVLPLGFAFNTNATEPSTDWNALLAPELQGRINTCEPRGAPIVGWYDFILNDPALGEEYLAALGAQNPRLEVSTVTQAQQLAAGEYDASACVTPGSVSPLVTEGAPLEFVIPEPAFGLPGGTGITGWAKHPNASQVLMDWLLSDAGQQALIEGQGTAVSPAGIGDLDISSFTVWDGDDSAATIDPIRDRITAILSGNG